ncbi:carboxypeptidase-like regulatory domain-containing protein [Halomonas sp. BM-2019]|uniref:carboxypeptidase-like regulatory domain-containing protein n=1 Tax=Halomonas sp. BM-2019 TaxID=2811227 RepID=UPI001B3C3BBF|nr:MAG: carboxypeptidase regulatory-like domain-containing protein [Halomonas sp. BM-2019]
MKRWIPMVMTGLLLAGCEIMPTTPSPTERIEVIDRGIEPVEAPDRVEERREVAPGRVARQVAFPAAEYAALEKQGSAVISGQLTIGGRPVPNAGVSAAPVTTYSAEAAEQALAGVAVEPADPRAREYTHSTRTDGNGRFRLNGLPAGHFYLSGAGPDPVSGEPRVVIRQVQLRNGQQLETNLSR